MYASSKYPPSVQNFVYQVPFVNIQCHIHSFPYPALPSFSTIQVALGVVGAHDAVVVGLRDVTSMANPELPILNLKTGVVEGTPATAYMYFLYIYTPMVLYILLLQL